MRIVITGADGFIGRNLSVRLGEQGFTDVVGITLESSSDDLRAALQGAGFVFHLAGINRPKDVSEFATGNAAFTETVCELLAAVWQQQALGHRYLAGFDDGEAHFGWCHRRSRRGRGRT